MLGETGAVAQLRIEGRDDRREQTVGHVRDALFDVLASALRIVQLLKRVRSHD